jgi:hypothetical protein
MLNGRMSVKYMGRGGTGLFYSIIPAFHGGTKENLENIIRISYILADIRVHDMLNTNEDC